MLRFINEWISILRTSHYSLRWKMFPVSGLLKCASRDLFNLEMSLWILSSSSNYKPQWNNTPSWKSCFHHAIKFFSKLKIMCHTFLLTYLTSGTIWSKLLSPVWNLGKWVTTVHNKLVQYHRGLTVTLVVNILIIEAISHHINLLLNFFWIVVTNK